MYDSSQNFLFIPTSYFTYGKGSPGDDGPTARVRPANTFFHRLGLDPGGVVAKEELLALSLSPDYRLECDICDRNYMLRRGCPCCRD